MKSRKVIVLGLAVALLFAGATARAQIAALRYQSAKVPVGTVFHFVKSNRDGTHAAQISVYVVARDEVEALKWDEGGDEATLVTARLDWSRFSVKHFTAWHLSRDAPPAERASLDIQSDQLFMSLMPAPIELRHWPWHSFDFDFTSLNLVLPHLQHPEREFSFWRTDFVYKDPPSMAELGEVRMKFAGREIREGKRVRRYTIGGPGLENTEGTWWADLSTGLLVEYEIPIADEPGYTDVRLKLRESHKLTTAKWAQFKRDSIGAK